MKAYNLFSFDGGIDYYLSVIDPEKLAQPVLVIVNVKELVEHSQYKITFVKPADGHPLSVIVHGSYLSSSNLTSMAVNFLNDIEDIMAGISVN